MYLFLFLGLATTLLIIIRAPLLGAAGFFGAPRGASGGFAGPATWCSTTSAAFLVGLHEL